MDKKLSKTTILPIISKEFAPHHQQNKEGSVSIKFEDITVSDDEASFYCKVEMDHDNHSKNDADQRSFSARKGKHNFHSHKQDSVNESAKHPSSIERAGKGSGERLLCSVCCKSYKNRSSLTNHMRAKHKLLSFSHARMPCLESGCTFRATRITKLISHLIVKHKMKFHCEKVNFKDKNDFWTWKKEAEDRCKSSYSAQTSAKTMVSGNAKCFLRCHRSGYNRSSADTNPKVVKKGSIKINGACTSFMDVLFMKEGGAEVHFCKTHYGHQEDGSHLRLTDDEKMMIRELILQGHTAANVIAIMKSHLPDHRHQLLKYSNIRNVSVKQNLLMTKGRSVIRSNQTSSSPCGEKKSKALECYSEKEEPIMNLLVEQEIEIKAENSESNSRPTVVVSTSATRESTSGEHIHKNELQKEIKAKIERLCALVHGLHSKTSLEQLNKNLDDMIERLESDVHIEVIGEKVAAPSNSQQCLELHKTTDGYSLLLVSSDDMSVDELNLRSEA